MYVFSQIGLNYREIQWRYRTSEVRNALRMGLIASMSMRLELPITDEDGVSVVGKCFVFEIYLSLFRLVLADRVCK